MMGNLMLIMITEVGASAVAVGSKLCKKNKDEVGGRRQERVRASRT